MTEEIRSTSKADIPGIKEVLDSSELFPSTYLDEMISDYLENPESEEIWFTCHWESKVIGFGYCVPEKLTDGTYNLLAIALLKECQGKGIGSRMIAYIEQLLAQNSKRVLIVETSSADDYKLTRAFYEKLNYRKEASIQDFWQEGENKVVYWKKLT